MRDRQRRLSAPGIDVGLTLGMLAKGRPDPCQREESDGIWRSSWTAEGPATLRIRRDQDDVDLHAWGPGAEVLLERGPGLIGLLDDPTPLVPHHPWLREVLKRRPGFRLARTKEVFRAVVPWVLSQLVQGIAAKRSYAMLVRRYGEPAPGPHPSLRLPPTAEVLGRLPSWDYDAVNVEEMRSRTVRRAAQRAGRLEEAAQMDRVRAYERLTAVDGIGAWTAANVMLEVFGDPDVVVVGDYNLGKSVVFAFTGREDGDDQQMLELLAPYAGQRGRVQRYVKLSGARLPRRAPRSDLRDFRN